jgi:hypothetical protein
MYIQFQEYQELLVNYSGRMEYGILGSTENLQLYFYCNSVILQCYFRPGCLEHECKHDVDAYFPKVNWYSKLVHSLSMKWGKFAEGEESLCKKSYL